MKGKYIVSSVLFLSLFIAKAQTGVISGKIVDSKSGETLIGATVAVDDAPDMAAVSDLDGNFTVAKVPAGKHKVKIRYIGYKEKEHDDVDVKPNNITSLYVSLMEDAVNLKEAVITSAATTKRDNESAIYIMQKNSTVIQSGISSEEMKRSPDKSSGDVIRRVSGSTIQDGKFAIIRGLSDRYNMALLNNVTLPSTEPDRKAFAFDIFPSNILDNIIIMKTGQPNLPSEWAGGIIQLNTRDIPEKNFFNVTYGTSFTEGTTFKPFKTYDGGKTDWLGYDSKVRPLPTDFPDVITLNNVNINANRDSTFKPLGKKLNNTSWRVREQKIARPNQSLQLSGGFAIRKEKVQLGGVFAVSYANSLRTATGTRSRFFDDGSIGYDYDDQQYNNSVTAALLGNIGVIIHNNHKIVWKNIYTLNSDKTTYLREGINLGTSNELKRTSLEFISSKVFSSNLSGEHILGKQEIKWRWNGGVTIINRDQPKTVRYSYDRVYESETQGGPNTSTDPYRYQVQTKGADPKLSAMFYSDLAEKVYNGGTDLMIPFKIKDQKQAVTVGYSYQNRQRSFSARNLFYNLAYASQNDSVLYEQNIDNIINNKNLENGKFMLDQVAFPQDQYRAQSQTHAAFVMFENNITERFKAVWGFRFESFSQDLTSPTNYRLDLDSMDAEGNLVFKTTVEDSTYTKRYFSGAYYQSSPGKVKSKFPLLPSVNLIYKLTEKMNLRASYSQSMSRPEFRECAPFLYYDFMREATVGGNVNLLQTSIHNVDLRYEYFMGKGQAINVSVFYKHFTNTIELTTVSAGDLQFKYNNARSAYLVGAELEVRKNFDFISKKLEDLTFVANLAYIYSRVNLDNVKNNAGDEKVRTMQGQSPYIINLGLSYQHPKIGTGITLLYNQVGERLYSVGEVGNASWYEHWRPLLDLQISQKFWKDRGIIRFTISDLIAAKSIYYQNDKPDSHRAYQKGKDMVAQSLKNYRTYALQLSFSF